MARNLILGVAGQNAVAGGPGLAPSLNNGYLDIYTLVQPVNPDTAVTTQVLLATLRFAATAMATCVAGLATFAAMTPCASAFASGTPTWGRCWASDHATAIMDGSVGLVTGYDIIISAVPITALAVVTATVATFKANPQ